MANPFLYPKVRHRRKLTPPVYNNYRLYKATLREEFGAQCVYCRALDRIKGYESFGVDHYRPTKYFPALETEYLNLYYACNRCNSLKRDYWPTVPQLLEKIFIPNPCEHVMFDHVRYRRAKVCAASRAGAFTIERLDLNDPDAVQFKEGLIRVLIALAWEIRAARKTGREVKKLLDRAAKSKEKAELARDLRSAKSNLTKLETTLKLLLG